MGTEEQSGTPGAADTAKKLANQTIDVAEDLGQLAVDIPVDTAKLLLSKLKALVEKVEKVVKDA